MVPLAKQVAAVVVNIGTAGVINCDSFVKANDAFEVQLAFPEVTVYAVSKAAPLILPPAPTLRPVVEKV